MKRIGVALGGGGARGLCHIEFLKVLDDYGLKPVILSGTSIGSIIGGFYAAGFSGRDMDRLIDQIGLLEISKMVDLSILGHQGLVKGKGVVDFLCKYLPARTFEDLSIPLKVVATDFWKREEVIFQSGPLVPAIRASISIPGVFKPVRLGSRVLTDGGAVNPVPFDIIRDQCDLLVAIDVSGTSVPHGEESIPSILEAVVTTFHIMETAVMADKLKISRPDIYLKPRLVNIQVLEFHRQDEILRSVQKDVAEFAETLKARLEERSGAANSPKRKRRFFLFG